VYGYYHLLAAVADPKHPEHADLKDWLGDGFDPAAFDVAQANAALLTLRV
jgi:hypothetical protein